MQKLTSFVFRVCHLVHKKCLFITDDFIELGLEHCMFILGAEADGDMPPSGVKRNLNDL